MQSFEIALPYAAYGGNPQKKSGETFPFHPQVPMSQPEERSDNEGGENMNPCIKDQSSGQ